MTGPRLTKRRRKFIAEYLCCWNASEAARKVGYSERSAGQIGSALLKNVEIATEIKRRIAEAAMGADEVLSRLAEQARSSIADVITVDERGWRLDLAKVQANGHLVKRIRETREGPDVELHDAQAALSLLGKHLGLFVDVHEVRETADVTVYIPDNTRDQATVTDD